MDSAESWYVVKQVDGHCKVLLGDQAVLESPPELTGDTMATHAEYWGPFNSQAEAIARRVGLIRAGKCQPQ